MTKKLYKHIGMMFVLVPKKSTKKAQKKEDLKSPQNKAILFQR